MLSFSGKIFGNDANGQIRIDDGQIYEVLPKTFQMFQKLYGKEAVEAMELLATRVLIHKSIPNDGYFARIMKSV